MRKANPLFVDSTKMRGDSILTAFELHGVSNHFGASVFVRVSDEAADAEKVFHLQPTEDGGFRTQVYLQHLTEIKYQFFLSRDEVVLSSSPTYTAMASHVISQDWAPVNVFDEPAVAETSEAAIENEADLEVAPAEEAAEDLMVQDGAVSDFLEVQPIPLEAESVAQEIILEENVVDAEVQPTLSAAGASNLRERLIGVALDRVLELNRKDQPEESESYSMAEPSL